MKKSIIHLAKNLLGIDKAIAWLIINKSISLLKNPISAFFMIQHLTLADQGLWYTFISLGALSVFAELGFTTVISQFVSYEFAYLKEDKNFIVGEANRIDRFWALIRFSIKTYLFIIPISIFILCIFGMIFFKNESIVTLIAWYSFCIVGGLSLCVSLFQSIFLGMDKAAAIQKNAAVLSLFSFALICFFLYLNISIWSLVLGNLISVIITSFLLFKVGEGFWIQLLKYKVFGNYSFWKEIIPLQWRYAITWASGFFVFSLSTPAIYKFTTPEIAGKYGLTLAIVSSINGVAYGWISTKIPKFSMLASKKDEKNLLTSFKKSFYQGALVYFIGILFFIILHQFLLKYTTYVDRFLNIYDTIFLILSNCALFLITSLAVYVRSHKIEPFIYYSTIQAVSMIILAIFALPIIGFTKFLLYNFIFLWTIMIPYMLYIFYKYKKIYDYESN